MKGCHLELQLYLPLWWWWGTYSATHMQRSEDNLQESALFYHVGLRDQIQAIRLGGKCLCSLSHLVSPEIM